MKGTIIWYLIISLFTGFVLGGAMISSIFPASLMITAPLVCDGEMSAGSSQYSYRPGEVTTQAHASCLNTATGEIKQIGNKAVVVFSLMVALAVFALLWISWGIRKIRSKPQ